MLPRASDIILAARTRGRGPASKRTAKQIRAAEGSSLSISSDSSYNPRPTTTRPEGHLTQDQVDSRRNLKSRGQLADAPSLEPFNASSFAPHCNNQVSDLCCVCCVFPRIATMISFLRCRKFAPACGSQRTLKRCGRNWSLLLGSKRPRDA